MITNTKSKQNARSAHAYIFPSPIASMMKKIDMKTQYESGLFSQALLLLGMLLMTIYTLIYIDQSLIFKALIILNLVAGFIFMSSFMVTTYQQYDSYLGAMEIQGINPNSIQNIPTKKNRKNQFLFYGGLLVAIAGVIIFYAAKEYSWRTPASIGCWVLGALMILLVFIKKKPKTKSLQPLSIAAGKAMPLSEREAKKKELLTSIKEGLSTLRKIENIEDNKVIRKMVADAVKADMDKLKNLNSSLSSNQIKQTNPMKGGI